MRNTPLSSQRQGFTLIELLIVVAIIAILAAIAVPNFLEAQMRAKVARTKSDLRTVGIALESYSVDNSKYPILSGYANAGVTKDKYNRGGIIMATCLSTPISYLTTTVMPDPFVRTKAYDGWGETDNDNNPFNGGAESYTYHYVNVLACRKDYMSPSWGPLVDDRPKYFLISYGPDYVKGPLSDAVCAASYGGTNRTATSAYLGDYATAKPTADNPNLMFDAFVYDPSNGSISGGDVIRHP